MMDLVQVGWISIERFYESPLRNQIYGRRNVRDESLWIIWVKEDDTFVKLGFIKIYFVVLIPFLITFLSN